MIVQRLEIISFGKFKNKIIDFTKGLNIICGNNESGKSTIISFIYAMLYGFGDNRGKSASLREKYTPWDGGECEGKLIVLLKNGESVTIYRKAGAAKKHDTLRIYNSDTAQELSLTPEEIVGVGNETFLKTLCIRQMSSAFSGTTDEIVQRLSNISSVGDENISFEKAVKLLDNARREIRPLRGSGGSLSAVCSQITQQEQKQMLKAAMQSEIENSRSLLPRYEENARDIQAKYEEALKNDYSANIAHLRGRIEEKEAQINIANSTKSKNTLNGKFIFAATGLFLCGVICIPFNIIFSVIAFILGIASIVMNFLPKKNNDNTVSTQTDEVEKLKAQLTELEKEKSLNDEKLVQLKSNAQEAQNRLSALNVKIESLILKLSDKSEDDLESLYAEKQNLERSLNALTLASEALHSAHDKMQRNFTPVLNKKASEYFSQLTNGKYTRIFSDEQFNLTIDMDIPRNSELFSGGTVDQLYLSLRLALADMLFEDSSSCIILDQPFLQYDSNRKENALKLLDNMTNNKQILLFTSDNEVFSESKKIELLT